MKLLTQLLTLVLLILASPSYAQISLSVQNKPLDKALVLLEKESGYSFFYNDDLKGLKQPVTVSVTDQDIESVLNQFLKNLDIAYEIKDNHQITLFQKPVAKTPSPEDKLTITGIVRDDKGEALIGVSVIEEGTTNGTITDIDGKYQLKVHASSTLLFNYIGFKDVRKPASSKSPLNVRMSPSAEYLNEIVVTALGIKKEKKALAYSVEEVKGDDVNNVKAANLASSLAGKVAGVNVSMPSSGVMGSSRVIIRGNGSLAGNNQPLYIVDGVPIDNSNYGQPDIWGGSDGGDGISSINSEDIESMSVLKGGTAAALYGSRAANGAIVITTKQGSKGKVKVDYSLSYTYDTPVFKLDDFQWEYGLGVKGMNNDKMAYLTLFGQAYQQAAGMGHPEMAQQLFDQYFAAHVSPTAQIMANAMGVMSFGAKLDGSEYTCFDGEKRAYSAVGKDNFKNFYENAWSLSNNISISGGSDKIQYRLSVGDKRYHDIMPNSKLSRDNITFGINSRLSEKFSIKTNMMFVYEKTHNRPGIGDLNANAISTLYMLPASFDITLLDKRVTEDGKEFLPTDQAYIHNPYFIAYNYKNSDTKNRLIGSVEAQYNFLPELYLRARFGGDMVERRSSSITPHGDAVHPEGNVANSWSNNGEFNAEAILGYNDTFFDDQLGVDIFAGWNTMGSWWHGISNAGQNFIDPNLINIGNCSEITGGGTSKSESYINSVFGQAEFSYNHMLYMTLAGRNDWFSALSYPGKSTPNHIFYPSVGLSFILSEAVQMPKWFPYAKLRGSWAQSGGGMGPYGLGLYYGYNQQMGKYPIGSISTSVIPDMNLKPLTSISYEFGFDTRFFDNRLGLDFTYYVRNTRDDIVNAGISHGSGYGSARINAGQVNNRGVELLLTTVPVRTAGFEWDLDFNFSYNHSEVKKISEGINEFLVETARSGYAGDPCGPAWIYHEVGQPYGILKGTSFQRNDQGAIMYDDEGFPMKGEVKKLGETVAPYAMGLHNSFSFHGFNLSFLIDAKFGGCLYSQTGAHLTGFGRTAETLNREMTGSNKGNDGKPVLGVVGEGVKKDGITPNDIAADPMTYYQYHYSGITEAFVYDASFIKLRELTFGYTFPKKMLKKAKIESLTLSLVAHNLCNLYDNVPLVDPESAIGIGNGQGLEYYCLPAMRNFGFNFNIKF